MKSRILMPLLAAGITVASVHGQAYLTFEEDLQGVEHWSPESVTNSLEWSPNYGGSVALTATPGWQVPILRLRIQDNPEMLAELQLALVNGGTLSYTTIVPADSFTGTPGWFETVQINNSQGNWDQSIGSGRGLVGIYGQTFPQADDRYIYVSYPIEAATVAVNDDRAQINPNSGFFELGIGLNAQDGSFSTATIYIDDIMITANTEPTEPEIPAFGITPVNRGLNLISVGGGQYDRMMVRTSDIEPAYSWVGTATPANPVSYSFTIKELPPEAGYESFIYLIPFGELEDFPDYTDPDYNAARAARFAFRRAAFGAPGGNGEFAYKVGPVNSNGPAGSEFWINDSQIPSTGLGGTLSYITSTEILGTWSVTFTSDTNFTLTAPDGTTSSGQMLQETADLFSGPLHVYFGNIPVQPANQGLSAVYSNASVTGVESPISDDFLLDFHEGEGRFQIAPATRTGVIIPSEEATHWLKWSLPATGFLLEQSPELGMSEEGWQPLDMTRALVASGKTVYYLLETFDVIDGQRDFFRLNKPPIIAPDPDPEP